MDVAGGDGSSERPESLHIQVAARLLKTGPQELQRLFMRAFSKQRVAEKHSGLMPRTLGIKKLDLLVDPLRIGEAAATHEHEHLSLVQRKLNRAGQIVSHFESLGIVIGYLPEVGENDHFGRIHHPPESSESRGRISKEGESLICHVARERQPVCLLHQILGQLLFAAERLIGFGEDLHSEC